MNIVLGNSSLFSATLNGFHNSVSVASGFYTNGNSSNPQPSPFEFLQFQTTSYPIFGVSFLNQNLTQSGSYNQVEIVVDASGTYRLIGGVIKLQGTGGGFSGRVVPYRNVSPFPLPFSVRDPVLGAVEAVAVAPSPTDNYIQVTYIPNPDLKIYYFLATFQDGNQRIDVPALGFLSPSITPPLLTPGWLQPRPDWDIQVRTIDKDGSGRVIYTTVGNTVLDDFEKVRTSEIKTGELVQPALPIEILLNSVQTQAPIFTSASLWILMIKSQV